MLEHIPTHHFRFPLACTSTVLLIPLQANNPILTNPSSPRLPSNLVIKKLRPSRWIAFITIAWSIIATLTGLCHSYCSLIACRLLLGAVEGGLFPGLTIYLTLFYTKRELALRVGFLFVSAALA